MQALGWLHLPADYTAPSVRVAVLNPVLGDVFYFFEDNTIGYCGPMGHKRQITSAQARAIFQSGHCFLQEMRASTWKRFIFYRHIRGMREYLETLEEELENAGIQHVRMP